MSKEDWEDRNHDRSASEGVVRRVGVVQLETWIERELRAPDEPRGTVSMVDFQSKSGIGAKPVHYHRVALSCRARRLPPGRDERGGTPQPARFHLVTRTFSICYYPLDGAKMALPPFLNPIPSTNSAAADGAPVPYTEARFRSERLALESHAIWWGSRGVEPSSVLVVIPG